MRSLPHARPVLVAAIAACGCAIAPSRYVASNGPPSPSVPAPIPETRGRAAEAAQPPPPAPRSLGDLVDLALSRDPTTRAAWHDARAAVATAGGSRAAYLPDLSAAGTFGRSETAAIPGRAGWSSTSLGASASVSWLLLDLGQRAATVRTSDLLARAASLGHLAAVLDLVLRVQDGYYGYLAARALVAAQGATVKQAETNLAAAEDRRRAGVATIADVLQARTAASQARLALQQLEGNALILRGQLATLVGLPPTAELEVGELPARVDVDGAVPEVDALLAEASARNPDLARARALADAAEAQATATARSNLPTLSAQAGASRTWYVDPSSFTATGWNAGLVLSFPITRGIANAYAAVAARETAAAARDRADATAQGVLVGVWSAYQTLRPSVRRVQTSRDLLESATASADVAAARYRQGVGSILDVLNAQSALAVARAEDVSARTDFFLSLANLARATGRLEAAPAASPRAPTAPSGPAPLPATAPEPPPGQPAQPPGQPAPPPGGTTK
jgi:outer membrane protein